MEGLQKREQQPLHASSGGRKDHRMCGSGALTYKNRKSIFQS